VARAREEHRELASVIRRLPGRFADRVSARTVEQIQGAAPAGRWEQAVDELITALDARAEVVTVHEREELRTVLGALKMPGERVDALLAR
jgi:hypothetical protein